MKHISIPDDNGPILAEEARIVLGFTGPAAHHNLICWLCGENHAVYDMHPNWVFRPCWDCQEKVNPPLPPLSRTDKLRLAVMFLLFILFIVGLVFLPDTGGAR
jgi:hypothetical protein